MDLNPELNFIHDINNHNINVVFSLNRACNLRCHHCCLNNEYKQNTEHMTIEMLENYFFLIEEFLSKNHETINAMTLLMSGAEISLLSDNDFMIFGEKIYSFYKSLIPKYPYVELSMITLSNLIDISDNKKNWIKNLYDRTLIENTKYHFTTSFERYTNRFSKPKLLEKWEANVKWIQEQQIPLVVLWSITKKDAEDAIDILNYFEEKNIQFTYLPLLPTGETKHNNISPNYEEMETFLKTVYTYPYTKKTLVQNHIFEYDQVINLILEQNGFIMLDLLQDLVWHYEKHNNFDLENSYTNKQNKNKFISLVKEKNEFGNKMNELWEKYLLHEKKYFMKSGCFTCEYFERCQGGFGTCRPVYNTYEKCSGFRNVLDSLLKK